MMIDDKGFNSNDEIITDNIDDDNEDDLFFGQIKRTLSNNIDVETIVEKVWNYIITIIIIIITIIIKLGNSWSKQESFEGCLWW